MKGLLLNSLQILLALTAVYSELSIVDSSSDCWVKVRLNGMKRIKKISFEQFSKQIVTTIKSQTYVWKPCGNEPVPPEFKKCGDRDSKKIPKLVKISDKTKVCDILGEDSKFVVNDNSIAINYTLSHDSHKRGTVLLKCTSENEPDRFSCSDDCETIHPKLQFSSWRVCPGDVPMPPKKLVHFSVGTIVLIAASSVLLLYFTIGVLYETRKGAKGFNRLPHSDFWIELPLLVMDGVRFTCGCFKASRPGYSRVAGSEKNRPQPVDV